MAVRLLASALLIAVPLAGYAAVGKPASGRADPVAYLRYTCADGSVVDARYPSTDAAEVRRNGQRIAMTIQRSADGARYTRAERAFGAGVKPLVRRFVLFNSGVRRYYVVNASFGAVVAIIAAVLLVGVAEGVSSRK